MSTGTMSLVKLVSVTKILQESEPSPATNIKLTDSATVSYADKKSADTAQESKDQSSLEDQLDNEGDGKQKEREDPKDTASGQDLTVEITVEKTVASESQKVILGGDTSTDHMEGNDNEHHPTPPSPPPQPGSSGSTTAVVVIAVAALSQVSIGATLTWSNVFRSQLATSTTTFFNTELYLSPSRADLADYLFLAGLATVLVPSGWMVTRIGRRRSLITTTFASIISWALHALASDDLLLLIGRFFAGLSVAMLKVSVTTYVTEVMVVSVLGQALVCLEIMKITGALICLGLRWLLPWYHIAFVNLAWMVVCGICFFFFPESPYYLVLKKKDEEAHDSLQRLRASGSNVEEELQIMKSHNPPEKANVKFSCLFRRPFISHIMALVGLSVVSVFSGSAVIMISGGDMLFRGGYYRQEIATFLVLLALVGGAILLFGFVDRIGRRLCLLVSLMILVLTYSGLGAIAYVASETPGRDLTTDPMLPKAWVIVRISLILLAAFSLTFGTHTVPTILAAEYFPSYCRPQGLAVFLTASVLLQALSLRIQPLIEDRLGLCYLYWLFGLIALVGIFYTNVCVYEIKYTMHSLSATCKWLFRENFYEPRPLI